MKAIFSIILALITIATVFIVMWVAHAFPLLADAVLAISGVFVLVTVVSAVFYALMTPGDIHSAATTPAPEPKVTSDHWFVSCSENSGIEPRPPKSPTETFIK